MLQKCAADNITKATTLLLHVNGNNVIEASQKSLELNVIDE
jgi:hypothetical protein